MIATATPRQMLLPLHPVPEPSLPPVRVHQDLDGELFYAWGHRAPEAFAAAVITVGHLQLSVEDLVPLVVHSWVIENTDFASFEFVDTARADADPITSVDITTTHPLAL